MTEQEKKYIEGLQNGDKEIFEQIFNLYYGRLCQLALRYVKNLPESEEVVQDFFCKLWENKEKITIKTSLNAYFSRSVANMCLNRHRNIKVERNIIEFTGDEIQESPGINATIVDNELNEKYNEALALMPDRRREIFTLSRFSGLKNSEIAKELNISQKTVESQMTRAFKFLKEYLQDFLE
ncbi:MAG: RNA polymerase sigma-70 factor [Lentimicrobiaceae bacterium]|nr:RNA polymerase sigma-70 factor [Lentimicrobiaceae bacterium]